MDFNVDPLAKLIIGEPPAPDLEGSDDANWIAKFIETQNLAEAIGGRDGQRLAAAFMEEASIISKSADAAMRHHLPAAPAEPENDMTLAKRAVSDRRKLALTEWVKSQCALGKTVRELVEHAERFDSGVANELREIALELDAA